MNGSLIEKSNTELDLNITLRSMSPNCAALISSVDYRFEPSFSPLAKIRCVSSQNQFSDRICSGIVNVGTKSYLNLCKSHQIGIRPIYSEGIFQEKINNPWISSSFGPLVVAKGEEGTQIQLKQQLPYVVEWNNPECLLAQVPYWHVRIYDNLTGGQSGPYFWYLPDKCSRDGGSEVAGDKSQGFLHSVFLPTEQVSSCATSNLQGGRWELSPCSSYLVKVTPILSTYTELEELSLNVGFATPFQSDGIANIEKLIFLKR